MWAFPTTVIALLLPIHHICHPHWVFPSSVSFSSIQPDCSNQGHACNVQSPGTGSVSPAWLLRNQLDHCRSAGFYSLAGTVILQGASKGTQEWRIVYSLLSPKFSSFLLFYCSIFLDLYRIYRHCSSPSICVPLLLTTDTSDNSSKKFMVHFVSTLWCCL